jgi:dolichol-phosphate mannosyltransferase
VLITGASGFVGMNLAARMVERGHAVHALVRAAYRPWRVRDLGPAVALHTVDLLDPAALDALFAAVRPHWVLHLAAYGAYASQTGVAACVRTNVEGTVNLIDAAARHGVERFVNTGSSSEYGFVDHAPGEDEAPHPNSLYAATKLAATAYAQHAGRSGAVHATTLRLYTVYGPYEEPTRLIPTVVAHGLAGRFPPLVSPSIARDFVYVDDVLAAYEAALSADVAPGSVYNVGSGTQTSLRTVVDVARSYFGIAGEPAWDTLAARTWDTTTWIAKTARARAELGWEATTTFEDGFARTAAWVSERPERRSFYQTASTPPE